MYDKKSPPDIGWEMDMQEANNQLFRKDPELYRKKINFEDTA